MFRSLILCFALTTTASAGDLTLEAYGTGVTVSPGEAVTVDGDVLTVTEPMFIDLELESDTDLDDTLLDVYLFTGSSGGLQGLLTSSAAPEGDHAKLGTVRVQPGQDVIDALQVGHELAHTIQQGGSSKVTYVDPTLDSTVFTKVDGEWGLLDLSDYAKSGSDVVVQVEIGNPDVALEILDADGTPRLVADGGILTVSTNPKGQADVTGTVDPTFGTVLELQTNPQGEASIIAIEMEAGYAMVGDKLQLRTSPQGQASVIPGDVIEVTTNPHGQADIVSVATNPRGEADVVGKVLNLRTNPHGEAELLPGTVVEVRTTPQGQAGLLAVRTNPHGEAGVVGKTEVGIKVLSFEPIEVWNQPVVGFE